MQRIVVVCVQNIRQLPDSVVDGSNVIVIVPIQQQCVDRGVAAATRRGEHPRGIRLELVLEALYAGQGERFLKAGSGRQRGSVTGLAQGLAARVMMRRCAGVNVHLLRVVGEQGLNSCLGRGRTQGSAGGERRSNIMDGGAVRPVKLVDHILPSHVMMAWVALGRGEEREEC